MFDKLRRVDNIAMDIQNEWQSNYFSTKVKYHAHVHPVIDDQPLEKLRFVRIFLHKILLQIVLCRQNRSFRKIIIMYFVEEIMFRFL